MNEPNDFQIYPYVYLLRYPTRCLCRYRLCRYLVTYLHRYLIPTGLVHRLTTVTSGGGYPLFPRKEICPVLSSAQHILASPRCSSRNRTIIALTAQLVGHLIVLQTNKTWRLVCQPMPRSGSICIRISELPSQKMAYYTSWDNIVYSIQRYPQQIYPDVQKSVDKSG